MEDSKMKSVFFGTPEFGAVVLEQLLKHGIKPILVVTAPDKPVGRTQALTPPPTKTLALANNIPVFQPEKLNKEAEDKISEVKPDIFVVAAYGEMLSKKLLDMPEKGALNVHPSLLPKYRGPSPVHEAILQGEKETGVSVILLDEKMDHGPILSQKTYKGDINSKTTPELTQELAVLGGTLVAETIQKWMNNAISPSLQNDEMATFTKVVEKEDGHIDWNKDAAYIERQIRAYNEWPGAYAFVDDPKGKTLRLKLLSAEVKAGKGNIPGVVSPGFKVQTGAGLLIVKKLQMEGKNIMSSEDFIRGYPWIISSKLK